MLMAACTEDSPKTDLSNVITEPETGPVIDETAFPIGADVSWLTELESKGVEFKNAHGQSTDCMELLREECNINSIRLRVWHNPVNGWCNKEDVLVKAKRAAALGMRVMIDFHFSDVWADPGAQVMPGTWKTDNVEMIKTNIEYDVTILLHELKEAGVTPTWVQIGNETRSGMLYQQTEGGEIIYTGTSGHYSNGTVFAQYVTAGINAAKKVFPDIKTIVHIDSGDKWQYYERIFGYLKNNNVNYDLIGLSLYPGENNASVKADMTAKVTSLLANIDKAYTTYGKESMVVEIGMYYDNPDACQSMLTQILDARKNGSAAHLRGLFYWEPEAPSGFNNYQMGAFKDGKPTDGLRVLMNYQNLK